MITFSYYSIFGIPILAPRRAYVIRLSSGSSTLYKFCISRGVVVVFINLHHESLRKTLLRQLQVLQLRRFLVLWCTLIQQSPLLKYPHSGAALGIYTVIGLIVYYLYTTIYQSGWCNISPPRMQHFLNYMPTDRRQ